VLARLCLCLMGIASIAACDAEDRTTPTAQPVTAINIVQGIPTLEAQSRVPFYVLISPNGTAAIWRADRDDVVTVGIGKIGSGLTGLSAAPVDPLLLFAEHNPPAWQMIEVAQSLNDQGFSEVGLVTPGGWVPPVPTEDSAAK